MIASLASVRSAAVAVPLLLAGLTSAAESPFKVDSREDILKSAKTLAEDLIALYEGNKPGKIPGILPGPPVDSSGPYYWWQAGAFMSTYLDYYRLTGDDTYNEIVAEGLIWQTGPNYDYLPPNQTASIGNDDQCFWASAALGAAEAGLPDVKGKPSWAEIAETALSTMAHPSRHDDTCDGGLRWQIPPTNVGYDYKNTLSNACYLSLAARVAKFTGNETYADIAGDTWDWLVNVGFIDEENYRVYDGGHVQTNCSDVNKAQFSINSALLVQGAAYMFNQTNDKVWRDRLTRITDATLENFFPDDVAFELPCEARRETCTIDMRAFKGITHRYLAAATELAPFLAEGVLPVLKKSTEAAVKTCTGGESGRECSFYWSEDKYVKPEAVGKVGPFNVGEQMNVLAAVGSLLVDPATGGPASPVTSGDDKDSENEEATETNTGAGPNETGPSGSGASKFEVGVMTVMVVGLGALFVAA
ncbi:glycosyl hydrolase [Rhypophila sp. PSN 637]